MQRCVTDQKYFAPHSEDPLEISALLLRTKSCLEIGIFFVSQEGARKIASSFGP